MSRFIRIVCMGSQTALVGVCWVARGFPMRLSDAHAKEGLRRDWEADHSTRGDDDAKRNAIRLDTPQAATASAVSPATRPPPGTRTCAST